MSSEVSATIRRIRRVSHEEGEKCCDEQDSPKEVLIHQLNLRVTSSEFICPLVWACIFKIGLLTQ